MKLGKDMLAIAKHRTQKLTRSPSASSRVSPSDRREMVDRSQSSAVSDPYFMAYIERADRARDLKKWDEAAYAYTGALELYPYERSYWTQLGHMLKEQEQYPAAEVAYRTACAFGAPTNDVVVHLQYVMEKQGVDERVYPIRFYESGKTQTQVPGRPDVIAFVRLLWAGHGIDDTGMLNFLRSCATFEELAVAM